MKRYIRSATKRSDGKEVVLTFNYPSGSVKDANRLCDLFDENNIEYKCYDIDSGYPIQFKVLRSGKTWDDIMKLINSIHPARYKKEKLIVDREGGTFRFKEVSYIDDI